MRNQGVDIYANEQIFLEKAGVRTEWSELKRISSHCKFKEHVKEIEERARSILFQNEIFKEASKLFPINNLLEVVENGENMEVLEDLRDPRDLRTIRRDLEDLKAAGRLFRSVRRIARTEYGRSGEKAYLHMYNANSEIPVVDSQQRLFRASGLTTPKHGFTWGFHGKIDGLCGTELVEIKYRTGNLLSRPPIYDLIQIHVYMFALEKKRASLVQCVATAEGTISHTDVIFFDDAFWAEIVAGVQKAMSFAESLVASDIAFEAFSMCTESAKAQLLDKHLGEKMLDTYKHA